MTSAIASASVAPVPVISPPPKAPVAVAWKQGTPCEVVSAELQAKVPKFLQEGKLERTGRVIEKANKLCPQTTKDTWATAVDIAATLGKYKEAQALIKAIESATDAPENAKTAAKAAAERLARFDKPWPDSAAVQTEQKKLDEDAQKAVTEGRLDEAIGFYEKEWEAWPPNGQALINAGLLASKLGKKADAQRYFDRGRVILETRTKTESWVDVQRSYPATQTTFQKIVFAPNGERIAVIAEQGLSIVETQTWREKIKQENTDDSFDEGSMRLNNLDFSPDGTRIATGTHGGSVQLRDAKTGEPLGPAVKAHKKGVTAMAFSPDSTRLATGSFDKSVRIWKIVNGKLQQSGTLKNTSFLYQMAFSPDGKFILGGMDESVGLWDARTGARIHRLKGAESRFPYYMVPAFSPDGEYIAAGSSWDDDKIRVWNARTGALVRTIPVYKGNEDRKTVEHLVYSRDGKRIIAQYDMDNVGIWDAETGTKVLTMATGVGRLVDTMTLSPDGKKLVLGFRFGHLLIYDTTTGAKLHDSRSANTANSAVFFPDGKRIISGAGSTIKIWNADGNGSFRTLVGHPADVTSVSISPDGKRIASGSNGDPTVRLWDAETGAPLPSLSGHTAEVNAVAFSPNGKRIASAASDETLRIWDATTGESLRTFKDDVGGLGGYGYAAVWSPDSVYIASKSEHSATVTNVEKGKINMQHDFRFPVYGMTWFYGRSAYMLAIGNNDDDVHFRYGGSPRDEYTIQVHEPHAVAISPDGKYLAAGSLEIARNDGGASTVPWRDEGIYPVTSLNFTPNGDLLLSASQSGTLRLWQLNGSKLLVRMDTLPGKDTGYLFTPNGEVDFVGADACSARDIAVCHIGTQSFPYEVCEDRWYAPGLLQRIVSGESAGVEPEIAPSPLVCPRVP